MLKPSAQAELELPFAAHAETAEPALAAAPDFAFVMAAGLMLVVCLCSVALLPVWAAAWHTWSSDPLRSIGMAFPLLSVAGVALAWRGLGWRLGGSWWGLAPMAIAIAGARAFAEPLLRGFVFGLPVRPLHPGMALFAYGAGAALLFGGVPLLRRGLAPLCLLLLVDPVPHLFNQYFDLPLQFLSANTARGFAHLIGLQPTGVQLQMMFAPSFGMFIVPGCNGVRGAVTLGYLALIFGYIRRLPVRQLAVFTVSAVLLGYLFNLVRLCTLVLYYRLGMTHPGIQSYGAQVDYAIGCTMFLIATLGVGCAITYYQIRKGTDVPVREPVVAPAAGGTRVWPAAACVVALAVAFFVPQARSMATAFRPALTEAEAFRALPQQAGAYTLTQTWKESGADGSANFVFGEYVRAGSGEHLKFGIYLLNEDHLVSLSKRAQGIVPAATGSLDVLAGGTMPAHFGTSLYVDGAARSIDAEALCRAALCDQRVVGQQGGAAFMAPHLSDLFTPPDGRRVPIVVREEWGATALPAEALQAEFAKNAREFVSALDLRALFPAAK